MDHSAHGKFLLAELNIFYDQFNWFVVNISDHSSMGHDHHAMLQATTSTPDHSGHEGHGDHDHSGHGDHGDGGGGHMDHMMSMVVCFWLNEQ